MVTTWTLFGVEWRTRRANALAMHGHLGVLGRAEAGLQRVGVYHRMVARLSGLPVEPDGDHDPAFVPPAESLHDAIDAYRERLGEAMYTLGVSAAELDALARFFIAHVEGLEDDEDAIGDFLVAHTPDRALAIIVRWWRQQEVTVGEGKFSPTP